MPKTFSAYKGARPAGAFGGIADFGNVKNKNMDKMKQEVRKAGRPKATDPKCHRYNFKLTEAQNIRFCQML